MDTKWVRVALGALAWIVVAQGAGAQESETLPTLKLDRIPAQPSFEGQTRAPRASTTAYDVEVVASGLSAPWALAFLPDGRFLVNEYVGAMRIVDPGGSVSEPLAGLPVISREGWAGLFDLGLDPDFDDNGLIYFSYAAPGAAPGDANIPRVARARLDSAAHRIEDVQVIVDGFGGQELLVAPGGQLYVAGAGNGDAQDLHTAAGKLLRLALDGTPASGNPFADVAGARAEIFSVGHRDVSGIALRPGSGDLWITEHGPRGGDELNRIVSGANYGWKVISYGTEYNGDPVGSGQATQDGMQQPRYFWWPSIAPSGLIFYTGTMFPEWQGNAFISALSGQHISRLVLAGDRVVAEERLLVDRAQRIRELRQGPDGALYALTNAESGEPVEGGQLLRISRNGN